MVNLLDLTLAADKRRVGVHLEHLLGERAVGTSLGRGGENGRKVEELAESGMGHDVLTVESWVPVAGGGVEADLKVENQEEGVVLVKALPWDGWRYVSNCNGEWYIRWET